MKGYRDELLREMGNPTDPLERMLIEQLALAHVMTMQLHVNAALAKTPDGTGIYTTAATRLMGEMRRMILAVREYRMPPLRPQVTRIEQQNVAEKQAVSYVASGDDRTMTCREEIHADGRQGSNDGDVAGVGQQAEIPGTRSRWTAEPAVAGSAHE